MGICRRSFISMLTNQLIFVARAIPGQVPTPGPILWSLKRNASTVYLFGFSDAKDRSWLTPTIDRAFRESTEIWFETPEPNPTASPPKPASGPSLADQLGHDRQRSLFDVLGPQLTARTLAVAKEFGTPREEIEHLRPWLAFNVINAAFRKKYVPQPTSGVQDSEVPDRVLAAMAYAEHKPVHTEYPDRDSLIRFYAGLSDEAQREHLEDLLDYIDDEKAGLNKAFYGWINGHPDSFDIDRMRQKRPALYQAMHVQRNQAWASRISGFLSTPGVYFICIGMNHVQGPDSILHCLEQIDLKPQRV